MNRLTSRFAIQSESFGRLIHALNRLVLSRRETVTWHFKTLDNVEYLPASTYSKRAKGSNRLSAMKKDFIKLNTCCIRFERVTAGKENQNINSTLHTEGKITLTSEKKS